MNAIEKINPLTSLRFFAAFAIVVAHSARFFGSIHELEHAIHIELRQGVTFFFVLSGFILTVIYSGNDFTKRSVFFSFIRKRIARLWPLHITTLVINAILVPTSTMITSWATLAIFFANALMLQSIIPLRQFYLSFNVVSWSISTEFYFYASLPILLLLARRSMWLPLLAVLPVALSVITLGNVLNLPIGYPNNCDGLTHMALVYINPLVRVFDFAVGVVTAQIFLKHARNWQLPNWQATLLESLSILLCWAILFVTPDIANFLLPLIGEGGKMWLNRSGFALIAFSFLILMFACQRGAISKFISAPHWVLLGDISFALYLCHMSILESHAALLPNNRSLFDWIVCVSTMLMLSHLLYTFIEKPFRKAILSNQWKSLLNLNGLKITPRTLTLASECLCLVGLAVFALGQWFVQYQRQDVVSATEANQKIASRAAYTRKFSVQRAGLICEAVVPNFEKDGVIIFFRGAKSADFDQLVELELLDKSSKELGRSGGRLGFLKKVGPGEVLQCRIQTPGLSRADKLAVRIANPNSMRYLDIVGDNTDSKGTGVLIPLSQMLTAKKDLPL
jgi:Predicted acyltransferases